MMVETRLALTLALLVGAGNAAILATTILSEDGIAAATPTTTMTHDASARTSTSTTASSNVDDPNTVLDGLYTECVLSFSFPCIQRKTLLFIERLGRSTIYPLVGNFLTLVRTKPADQPELSEDKLRYLKGEQLADMVDTAVTDFFQNHVFRLQLPHWMIDSSSERRSDNALDFYIGDSEVEQGRKKIGGGGGKKGMKKMMMMMCMMIAGKAMMLGPMMLGLTKIAAIKALILSFISLTISKIMILKKLQKMKGSGGGGGSGGWSSGGGGGGGGWSSGGGGSGGGWSSGGGGGGWDRSLTNHELPYKGYLTRS